MANRSATLGLSLAFLVALVTGVVVAMGAIPLGPLPERLEEVRQTVASKTSEFAKILSPSGKAENGTGAEKSEPATGLEDATGSPPENKARETAKSTTGEVDVAPVTVPVFDVFQVGKDGSVLATGKTTANTAIELVTSGGDVLAKTTSNPGGEFVLLPEKSILSGDHVFKLRVQDADGQARISEEAGVVLIPEYPNAKPLALVTKQDPAEAMETLSRRVADPTVKAPDVPENSEIGETTSNDEEPAKTLEQPQKVEQKKASLEREVDPVISKQPVAENSPSTPKPSSLTARLETDVMVKAVEVDHRSIFIAGEVQSGAFVQLYVDNKPVGGAEGTPENRFFLRAHHILSSGKHMIRADLIDPTNGSVLGRAEVPLIHDPAGNDEASKQTAELNLKCISTCAPPMETGKSLIVRPGDNLWRVAKRTFGTGRRYKQIFDANRDQIEDPDNITVGQAFQIPQLPSN